MFRFTAYYSVLFIIYILYVCYVAMKILFIDIYILACGYIRIFNFLAHSNSGPVLIKQMHRVQAFAGSHFPQFK